ncbi:MAG: TIGR01212 family radical SAM protein [Clostridia bacterium]|nr:TIGR01212 family radical SAM protein [Clostridia bacterium]
MDRFLYAKATSADAGRNVKDFLRARWGISSALLIALKQYDDGITVNGARVSVAYRLSDGDSVCISVGDHGVDSGFEATEMPLEILYEDSDLILLNKPPFLPVHPSKGHVNDTLDNGLTDYYHKKGETFVSRCVLRLDANTSGAVLFAKNQYAHDRLRRRLEDGTVHKEYLALVHGQPSFHGRIDAPIYRPEEATLRRIVDPRGKAALTEYVTEKSNGTLSLLRVIPHTGRTHQIRLHLSYLGTPMVSDFLYGEEHDGVLSRHGLHCASISFPHPVTGKQICVKAPLAADMRSVCDDLPTADRYRSLDSHLRRTYGEKLVKLALNGGFSCPNREHGGRGCSFCSEGGSGEFAVTPCPSIRDQLDQAKKKLSAKWLGYRYIAYFQAYTNTYGPLSLLRSLFEEAISDPEVAVLSIATRPDCLPAEVLDLLSELSQRKPLWVELGLQTSSDETAARMNRGYDRIVYETAVRELRRRGISVITHLIFGLPGETEEQMLDSVRYVSRYTDGIKLQMLQVLKGSVLGERYESNPFPLLTEDAYVNLICEAIALLPDHVTVHRLTGDPPEDLLIAPAWTADKKRVLARIRATLNEKDIVQGAQN